MPSLTTVQLGVVTGGAEILLTGLPAVEAVGHGFCTSATLAGPTLLEFHWITPFSLPATIRLAANDPAVRTVNGAYLAPFNSNVTQIPFPPAAIATFTWTIVSNGDVTATMSCAASGGVIGMAGLPVLRDQAANQNATGAVIAGTDIVWTFPSVQNPGTSYQFQGALPPIVDGASALAELGPHMS